MSDFARFAPFCGCARAPGDNARLLKQGELDGFGVFSIMRRIWYWECPVAEVEEHLMSSSSSAACAELFLARCKEVFASWVSKTVDLFLCRTVASVAHTSLKELLLLKQTLQQRT